MKSKNLAEHFRKSNSMESNNLKPTNSVALFFIFLSYYYHYHQHGAKIWSEENGHEFQCLKYVYEYIKNCIFCEFEGQKPFSEAMLG